MSTGIGFDPTGVFVSVDLVCKIEQTEGDLYNQLLKTHFRKPLKIKRIAHHLPDTYSIVSTTTGQQAQPIVSFR